MMLIISVQETDFQIEAVLKKLPSDGAGAEVIFTGIVRQNSKGDLKTLELEHYPSMTEASLTKIGQQAMDRFSLTSAAIIHRVGTLAVGDKIMMVTARAPHRGDAFDAAEFMMDYLKSRAPFWKKEVTSGGAEWVNARVSDEEALRRWGR